MEPRLPSQLLDLTSYVLSLSGRAARNATAAALAERGLRLDQVAALAALADFGPSPQRELGARLRLDPGDVVRLVDDLEQHGFAQRERDPADRRRQIVSLTPAGRRTLRTALRVSTRAQAALLDALDEGEQATLHTLLRRVLAHADARAALDEG
jgi:DNA-binding MarR family transcriptional regulator